MIIHHDRLYSIIYVNLSIYFLETKIAIISYYVIPQKIIFLNILINIVYVFFKGRPVVALQTVPVCMTKSTCSRLVKR